MPEVMDAALDHVGTAAPAGAPAAAATGAVAAPHGDVAPLAGRRVAVLVLTYGEPPEQTWRAQYGYSLSILHRLTRMVAPIPKVILPLLAANRARIRKKTWIDEQYSSPLEAITLRQVEIIRALLNEARPDVEWDVREVYEFRDPFMTDVLADLARRPPDEVVALPIYLAESDYTHNISRLDFARFRDRQTADAWRPDPKYILRFGYDERMGEEVARFAIDFIRSRGWDEAKTRNAGLIMGAHGTLAFPKPGVESGRKETSAFYGILRRHLKPMFREVRIGWLNHVFGGEWTKPEVAEMGEWMWERGVRDLVYFPFGFLADNAESELEGKVALREWPWEDYLHLPCPNEDRGVLGRMVTMTLDVLEGRATAPKFEAKVLR